MTCQRKNSTILPTPRIATSYKTTQLCSSGVHPVSSQTFTATLAAFKRLITSRGATKLPERTACMSATRGCRHSTEAKTLTSCLPVIIAHSKINFYRQTCVSTRTSFGSWSPKLPAKEKESKWFHPLMRFLGAPASRHASCNNTFTIHCWSMATSGICASMWPSHPSTRWGSTFMRRVWSASPVKNTTRPI